MKWFLQQSMALQWHQHACQWVRSNFPLQKQPQSRTCLLVKHHQYRGNRPHCLLSCLSVTLVQSLHNISTVHKEPASARFRSVVFQPSMTAHELHFLAVIMLKTFMFVMIATQSRECKAHANLDICTAIQYTHANDNVGSHCIGLANQT